MHGNEKERQASGAVRYFGGAKSAKELADALNKTNCEAEKFARNVVKAMRKLGEKHV